MRSHAAILASCYMSSVLMLHSAVLKPNMTTMTSQQQALPISIVTASLLQCALTTDEQLCYINAESPLMVLIFDCSVKP